MQLENQYTFDDVLIIPTYSNIKSRKECDTAIILNNDVKVDVPILSANMFSIGNSKVTNLLNNNGAMGSLHRFYDDISENIAEFEKCENKDKTWVSLGIGEKELERAISLFKAGAKNFIIDIAHGASRNMVEQFIDLYNIVKPNKPNSTSPNPTDINIMVGNFGSYHSFVIFMEEIASFGTGKPYPDFVKLGIGSGANCTTRTVTGVGAPQFSLVKDFKSFLTLNGNYHTKLVSDGGINKPADFCKAIAAGADLVMMGKIIASCTDIHTGTVTINGVTYAEHFGSASKKAYKLQGKESEHRTPEGESTLVELKNNVAETLQTYKAALQSSMSYVNAKTIKEYREKARFVAITNNVTIENGVRL